MTRLLLLACLLLPACQAPATAWQSEYLQEHPLAGKIWHAAEQRFITREELTRHAAVDVLLIGEKHDNPDHHRLRHQLLLELHREHGLGLVALEMLDSSQQAKLRTVSENFTDTPQPDAVREQLGWDEGWDWPSYAPLLIDLLHAGVPLRAANISRAEVNQVYQGQLPEQAAIFGEEQLALLKQDIDASHCGMLPADQFDAMVRVQQARDFSMAGSLVDPGLGDDTRVLVAGNYHIRQDLGVPRYLAQEGIDSTSIAFLEVTADRYDPQAYLIEAYSGNAFDFVWFTPASSQEDYCASLR